MNDRNIRDWLRNWNTGDFLREQRERGRSGLPPAMIARYAEDHDRVADLMANASLSTQDIPLARMLEAITAPLAALRADPIPRYYSYTGVNVLDEYIDGERLDLDMQKALCIEGIRGLMIDLTRFESHSLVGIEPWSTQKLDSEVIVHRLKLLKRQFQSLQSLADMLHVAALPIDAPSPRVYSTLEAYCKEQRPLSAVVQFTCIPSSRSHDEVSCRRTKWQSFTITPAPRSAW